MSIEHYHPYHYQYLDIISLGLYCPPRETLISLPSVSSESPAVPISLSIPFLSLHFPFLLSSVNPREAAVLCNANVSTLIKLVLLSLIPFSTKAFFLHLSLSLSFSLSHSLSLCEVLVSVLNTYLSSVFPYLMSSFS